MKKIAFAMTILATVAAIIPANAAPLNPVANAKMFATSPGASIRIADQCWKQTDAGRGYGFWTTCDQVAAFGNDSNGNGGGTEGGGGGDGGNGGDGGGER
jgi:uncharacterized membrane protein YgcG